MEVVTMERSLVNSSVWRRFLALIFVGTILIASKESFASNQGQLSGALQSKGGDAVNFTDHRMIMREGGHLAVRGIVRYEDPVLVVRHQGKVEDWRAHVQDGKLLLGHGTESGSYVRLEHVPDDLDLRPLKLPAPKALTAERVALIQREVAERLQKDQTAIKNGQKDLAATVIAENTQFLTALVKEIGWLDEDRFGEKTAVQAVILAKHSGDLGLMMAALPRAEKDLKHSGDGQTFAVLYDGLQIDLGEKQKYGTQISEDNKGQPYVLPLENPGKVD